MWKGEYGQFFSCHLKQSQDKEEKTVTPNWLRFLDQVWLIFVFEL